jgi:phosphatidylglycerol:prolipoprotein diacylglycerol transferase
MIVTGILSGAAICKRLCAVQNINFFDFIIISAIAGAFGFAGAKIFFLLDHYGAAKFFKALTQMLFHPKKSGLISSGFVFYGGLIGGIPGYFLGVKIARCGIRTFLNTFAFAIPYVHAFGRIGCFCAGCCYGIEHHRGFSVAGRFPVQLVEAFLLFIFAFVVLGLIWKKAPLQEVTETLEPQEQRGLSQRQQKVSQSPLFIKNHLFLIYILYYSIIRFFLEFLRGDEARGRVALGTSGTLSVSQVVSVILFLADSAIIIWLLIKNIKTDKLKATEDQHD